MRPGQLHVAIIGAGATGTELAAELHRTVREVVAYGMTRLVPERDIKIILIEAAPRILPALPERMSKSTADLLESLDIVIRTNARVAEVRADGVVLSDGDFIPSELVVWSAGVKGPEFLKNLGLETNRINQIVVHPTLQSTTDPNIFAIGDCAACPREGFPARRAPTRPGPPTRKPATWWHRSTSASTAARSTPFTYRDFGSLVSLGKYSTVGNLMGFAIGRSMFIEGYFARLMYRSLYAMHLAALHGHRADAVAMVANLVTRRPRAEREAALRLGQGALPPGPPLGSDPPDPHDLKARQVRGHERRVERTVGSCPLSCLAFNKCRSGGAPSSGVQGQSPWPSLTTARTPIDASRGSRY